VRAATFHGDKVTAVGWTQEDDYAELLSWQNNNSIGLLCDVRLRETIDKVLKKSIEHWGRIDIIARYVLRVSYVIHSQLPYIRIEKLILNC
jgi:hypothetical protein